MKRTAIYAGIIALSFVLCGCNKVANHTEDAPTSEAILGGWEITSHDAEELQCGDDVVDWEWRT